MSELTLPARVALVGNPNSGKTALFNALTGSRQKVANYPGVTVERKEGLVLSPAGHTVRLVDLPGTYSLRARSLDEIVTRDIVLGRLEGLALLAWYVFAPQCASTLGVVRRETASWKWTVFLFSYMLALAYLAACVTYHTAAAFGAG